MSYDHKEYMREYNRKNKEKYKLQNRERALNYYYDNKEHVLSNVKKYQVEYVKTAQYQKSSTISRWRSRGINCNGEWDEVFDWWLNAKTCDICDKGFDKSSNKCLDHDHILEGYNVRGILCRSCNNVLLEL